HVGDRHRFRMWPVPDHAVVESAPDGGDLVDLARVHVEQVLVGGIARARDLVGTDRGDFVLRRHDRRSYRGQATSARLRGSETQEKIESLISVDGPRAPRTVAR